MPVPLVPLDVDPPVLVEVGEHHRTSLRPDVAAFGRRYGWRVRFDARTRRPRFAIGRAVPGERLDELVADLAALSGVDPASLERLEVRGTSARSSIRFEQRFAGLPIAGAGIDVFLRRGRISGARVDLHRVPADTPVDGTTLVAPFQRGDELAYTGVTVSEGDGMVTWFDRAGAPVQRFTRVLEADGVVVQTADGARAKGARPLAREVERARAWLGAVDPEHPWLDRPTVVQPDALGTSCRAEFRDDVLRFGAGDGRCPAPSASPALIWHEFAHGTQVASLLVDRLGLAATEGGAATVAAIGAGSLDPATLPSHGASFATMAWGLRTAATERAGGVAEVDRWLVDLLRYGPALEDLAELALLADDDDGDLMNGTPQDVALWTALASTGLGATGLGTHRLEHTPLGPQPSSADTYAVTFDLTPVLPGGPPSNVRVVVEGEEPVVVPVTSNGPHHLALLPRVPAGRVVSYALEWDDGLGRSTRVDGLSFQVGDTRPVTCDLAAVDPRVDGAGTLLRAEGWRDARASRVRAVFGGRNVWSADRLVDGGRVPFTIDLRGAHAGVGPLVFSADGELGLDDVCVVALDDPAGHYRVSDLRVEGRDLKLTAPFVEPLHALELLVHDTRPSTAAGGRVLERWADVAPGAALTTRLDGPGFYVVRAYDRDGHAYDEIVEGANLLEVVDTGDTGHTGHTGHTGDTGLDAEDTGWVAEPVDSGQPR